MKGRAAAVSPASAMQVREAPGLPWPLRPTGDLPDINVWLALAVQEHPHHAAAARYWSEAQEARPSGFWFCRVTMLGLVRLLCQPKVVGEGALQLPAAWGLYQSFRAVPGVGLLADPPDCDEQLAAHLIQDGRPLPARCWTDAYLAAMAQSAGLRLVSFDKDFQRFKLAQCLVLQKS